MDIKEFVSQSLIQIIEGVREAQSKSGSNASVNPGALLAASGTTFNRDAKDTVQDIQFDIAVTVESKETTQAGGDVGFKGLLQVAGSKVADKQTSNVSRITFKIPVVFPRQ